MYLKAQAFLTHTTRWSSLLIPFGNAFETNLKNHVHHSLLSAGTKAKASRMILFLASKTLAMRSDIGCLPLVNVPRAVKSDKLTKLEEGF